MQKKSEDNIMTYLNWAVEEANTVMLENEGLQRKMRQLEEEVKVLRANNSMDNVALLKQNTMVSNQLEATKKLYNNLKLEMAKCHETTVKEYEMMMKQQREAVEKQAAEEIFKLKQDIQRLTAEANRPWKQAKVEGKDFVYHPENKWKPM